MKSAFVTGGGGYLGRKLCRELAMCGYVVTAFDLAFPDAEIAGVTNIRVSFIGRYWNKCCHFKCIGRY